MVFNSVIYKLTGRISPIQKLYQICSGLMNVKRNLINTRSLETFHRPAPQPQLSLLIRSCKNDFWSHLCHLSALIGSSGTFTLVTEQWSDRVFFFHFFFFYICYQCLTSDRKLSQQPSSRIMIVLVSTCMYFYVSYMYIGGGRLWRGICNSPRSIVAMYNMIHGQRR